MAPHNESKHNIRALNHILVTERLLHEQDELVHNIFKISSRTVLLNTESTSHM